MTPHEVAQAWLDAGFSVVPPRQDGSKAPLGNWKQYMHERATDEQLALWYSEYFHDPITGVGLVCGAISGNLEMLELEGRATDGESLDRIWDACMAAGVTELWERLCNGYMERTPSGGIHFLYRIPDQPHLKGNTKIARRPATAAELAANPEDKIKTLAETRGDGGYVIVAPSHGRIHPSGESWDMINGQPGVVIDLHWDDRCRLHEAIHVALDEMPVAAPPPERLQRPPIPGEKRPGDDFAERVSWHDILLPHGWVPSPLRGSGDKINWTRPGKTFGTSATTSESTGGMYVFSTSTEFEPEKPYSKFGAYAVLEHNGDFSAAASELARRGLGTRPDSYTCGVLEVSQPPSPGVRDESLAQASTAGVEVDTPATVATEAYGIPLYSNQVFRDMNNWDGDGISEFWARLHAGTFRYVGSDKRWCHWNGVRWEQAEKEREVLAARAMTAKMRDHAVLVLAEAQRSGDEERIKEAKARLKEAKRATQSGYAGPLLSMARTDPRISAGWEDFDRRRELITLDNGVLNLDTFEFTPHDPSLMLTRKVNARYDPDKKEGRFTRFMEEVLPNQEVREFLQRACGYALTGNADDRVLIQLYGPSGSGKSQFMKAVFNVMGDFAKRSSDTAFQARSNGYKGPSEDLHSLRGSRFAMMPELDEGFRMNVALIKQLTGGDPLTTRKLYGQEVTWRPEFTVFMITNHLPRVAAGEDAYWNRVKPIKFGEVFVNSMGETLRPEDRNLGERMAAEEPEVILNWLLEGLKNYRERGLDAPEQITQWRDDYRDDVDTVRQFLHEAPGEGRIEIAEKASVPVRQMHLAYRSWCADNEVTPLGMRKFNERVESAGYQKHRKSQGYVWQGIGLAGWLGEAVAPNLSVYRGGNRWEPRN